MSVTPAAPVVDLLRSLIRAACVNDGTDRSGQESRAVTIVADALHGGGLETRTYEPLPGRSSLVARIEGSDPTAPTLLLMGHTDVVPVSPAGWSRDPHAAEVVDGEVWGRGAVDMLNLTASMAVATRRLADQGFRPRGTLVFLAVADEEAGGRHGAGWLVEHARDDVRADYVVTESGGVPMPTPAGWRLGVTVGEKGICWTRLRVRGTPGHGSRPLRTDNALVKAAEVVTRLASYRPVAHITDVWRAYVEGMAFEPDVAAALTDPARVRDALESLPLGAARLAHACTHLTLAPTVVHGGTKTNVIPDAVDIDIDVRLLPGQSSDDLRRLLDDALGDLRGEVEATILQENPATVSRMDTPLWDAITRCATRLQPDAVCIPTLTAGGTDARYFRALGVPAYGFGLFSRRMTLERYSTMFHGNDERVDVESLALTVDMFEALARDLLG